MYKVLRTLRCLILIGIPECGTPYTLILIPYTGIPDS